MNTNISFSFSFLFHSCLEWPNEACLLMYDIIICGFIGDHILCHVSIHEETTLNIGCSAIWHFMPLW
jgi:hypothetical protein